MEAAPAPIPAPPPAPPIAPRRKRRWLRRLGYVALLLALLVVFAPFALSIAPVRRFVAERISDATGRRVTIGGITARWWSGIELRNVEVHNPEGFPGDPLLSMDRIHADVSVLPLLSGTFEAAIDVESPVVTLLRKTTGERNTDRPRREGAGGGATKRAPQPETGHEVVVGRRASRERPTERLDVSLKVEGGRIVSQEIGGPSPSAPDVIDTVEASFHVGGQGAVSGWFSAVARGAGTSGQDARFEARAELDADGAGPLKARIPAVDLARLRKFAGAALDIDAIAGTAAGDVDLVLDADGNPTGTVHAELSDVSIIRREVAIAFRRAVADVRAARKGDETRMQVDATVEALRASGFSTAGDALDEPRLKVAGVVVRGRGGDMTFGEANAPVRIEGRLVSGSVSGSVTGSGADAAADVSGDLSVVLSPTVGRWLGLLATPDEDLRGTVRVRGRAAGKSGAIDLSFDATANDLVLGGGAGRPPLREPSVTAVARGRYDGNAHTLTLASATLSAGTVSVKADGPIVVSGLEEGGRSSLAGAFTADADLARLAEVARALDLPIGWERGETFSGHAGLTAGVKTSGDAWSADAKFEAQGFRFPASWGDPGTPGRVDGRVVAKSGDAEGTITVESATLAGYGLDVKGNAAIARRGGASRVEAAHLEANADLLAAGPVIGTLLHVPHGAVLSGRLASRFDVKRSGDGRALTGHATVERFVYSAGPGRGTFKEASIAFDPDVAISADGLSFAVKALSLKSGAGSVDAKGSARSVPGGYDLDLTGRVDGDAKALGGQAKAFLGESFDDLDGDGRLAGTFMLAGPTTDDGRGLRMDADVSFARVQSGGLSLEGGRVTVKRPQAGTPVLVTAQSTVNRGTFRLDGSVDLGRDKSPWKAKADFHDVDTSALIVGKGAGRFLPMILPTILPAGASTPVLSGLMTASLDLGSTSISETDLSSMLRGPGSIALTQGTVSNSTLFAAVAGGGGSKGLTTLVGLVPGVGKTFRDLGRALVFTDLSSRFELGNRQIRLLEVKMRSHSISLAFDGVVGFDGALSLRIPVRLEGDVGSAVKEYVPDRTIPMKVSGKVRDPKISPDLDLKDVVGKGLLDDLKKKLR